MVLDWFVVVIALIPAVFPGVCYLQMKVVIYFPVSGTFESALFGPSRYPGETASEDAHIAWLSELQDEYLLDQLAKN